MSDLPLNARKNIKENEAKKEENLIALEKATGQKWTYEINFKDLLECTGKPEKCGDYGYSSYLGAITKNIVELCKDEMCKEVFLEKAKNKKIIVLIVPDEPKYNSFDYVIVNGDLHFHVKKGSNSWWPSYLDASATYKKLSAIL